MRMRTQILLWLLTAVWISSASLAAEKPNVLLILVDDLKPVLGCYGDKTAKTPNMDRLAASGMRFDLAYCNQAVCAPSRFTLLLGSHSTSTGLYFLGSHLREIVPNAVTMPQFFAERGYRTESLGKVFHIGHGNEGDPASFSVPHFKEKVIEYLDPASTDGGKLTREEAYFTNQQLGNIGSLPRGAAFESPDVKDEAYADGRVAAETVRRLQAAKERRKNRARRSLSPRALRGRICRSARRGNTGIFMIPKTCRCRSLKNCPKAHRRSRASGAVKSATTNPCPPEATSAKRSNAN